MRVPIAAPPTGPAVIAAVVDVAESGQWTNGPQGRHLEAEFAAYCAAPHCIGVSSGTAALVLVGEALGLSPGDRVLVPGFTFAATANAFLSLGCRVECVDVDPVTFNLDATHLNRALSEPAAAVVVVDLYGNCAGTDEIIAIAERAGARVIEDAAQAHGAIDEQLQMVGAREGVDATTFSLYATKNLAGGEGGLITTSSAELTDRLLELRSHGAAETYVHRSIGLNHRLTEFAAAIVRVQLRDLDADNDIRRAHASRLDDWCQQAWGSAVRIPQRAPAAHVLHQYTVVFDSRERRDGIAQGLRELGVDARLFYPYIVAELPGVQPADLPVAKSLRDTVLSLPVHPRLDEGQLDVLRDAIMTVRGT
jgi:dTDP-4-amino-4,6-dideoxygalactose transaminase